MISLKCGLVDPLMLGELGLTSGSAGNPPVRFDERDVETEPWWNH
jgi:hypothetical protein